MMLIDAHLDLAWNAARGRDLRLSIEQLRAQDPIPEQLASITFEELRGAGLKLCFATLFALRGSEQHPEGYQDAAGARTEALAQLEQYQRWEDQGLLRVVRNRAELEAHLSTTDEVLGVILLMEGADPIRDPDELPFWVDAGVRIIGPAWERTRYAGGTDHPGPLTPLGHELVQACRELGLTIDLSHLDDAAFWDVMELGPPVIATHANARALVPHNLPHNRQLTDEMIKAIGSAGGMIGLVMHNRFFSPGWQEGDPRASWQPLAQHAEHLAQLIGWDKVGLGTDLDGGFGLEKSPRELQTYRQLPDFLQLLPAEHRTAAAGQNWLNWLRRAWNK